MIDSYAIALEVAKHWLPADEETGNARVDVMRALTRPQQTGPLKQARRLTVGWLVATANGGFHSLGAGPLRPLSNHVAQGSTIEEIVGDLPISEPTVVVKLAKAGLTDRNFQPSFGDILRVNEAGRPCKVVDLTNVRELTRLSWRVKPAGKWFYEAKRALAGAKLGDVRALESLTRPPFNDDPGHVLEILDRFTDDDISYAINLLIRRKST